MLAEGAVDDLVHVLNRGRLIAVCAELMLPVRVLWEARFTELRPAATAWGQYPDESAHI